MASRPDRSPVSTTASPPPAPPAPAPSPAAARSNVLVTDALLLAMALIWGVNYSVVKFGAGLMPPLAFNGMRIGIAALALLAVTWLMREPWPARRTVLALLGLGVLGNGVYQVLFIEGVARTRAGDAALVLAAAPAFVAVVGRILGIERITRRGVVGIALSVGGMALVVLGGASRANPTTAHASVVGDLLLLVGSLSWSTYTVLLKPHTHAVSGVQISALTMLGGAVPLVALAAPSMLATPWSALPVTGWGAVAYSSLLALVVAYLFWYRGIRVLGPTTTAMYGNLQPIIALVVAWLLLGEVPTAWQIGGTAAIMGGLVLTRA